MDMKKILLVGEFNTTTENMNRILGKHFQVQLGSEDPKMVMGLLKMEIPDLILISTTGMEEPHREIFEYIQRHCLSIPVVCVGTGTEFEIFEDFFGREQIHKIQRPVQMKTIIERINKCLGTGGKAEENVQAKMERGKLLLVDDSKIQLRMLKSMLQKEYDVEVAESCEDAMRLLRKNIPDVIFLDYDMPGVDGKETLERIRGVKEFSHIPIVFLTGVTERKKIQEVLSMNPAAYILKPIEQKRLNEVLRDIFGQ